MGSAGAFRLGKAVIIRSIEHLLNILYATSGLLSIVTILYPRARFMLVLCSFGFASPIVAWDPNRLGSTQPSSSLGQSAITTTAYCSGELGRGRGMIERNKLMIQGEWVERRRDVFDCRASMKAAAILHLKVQACLDQLTILFQASGIAGLVLL
ncbi:hypothetical protein T12_5496 [Trichinella patagoniensis]|uniref:Uncharacterized protein n=1 Tax=Trichinella patagoniensis TaxID=990121 RepID=A0A0V0ZLI9_9BILA|nr:hypothetical protein T12_5496 [Trichinella patagoniensis]